MPRISVDIDLTYLPVEDRHTSLVRIEMAMRRMARSIQAKLFNSQVKVVHREGIVTKIFVIASGVQVKVEVTPVMRGCVFAPQLLAVQPRVEAELGFAQMAVVSFADLYAGKIVAALDRQHPRDLFDLRELLALEGITQALRQTFIVYLISHNRTMAEVLAPTRRNLEHEFETSLVKMTRESVTVEDLYVAREVLISRVVGEMPDNHRQFLLSFLAGAPDWALIDIPGVDTLPAVRWKMHNLAKVARRKRVKLLSSLEKAFG